jgi:hypothetical protein
LYRSTGAVAEVFDLSPTFPSPLFYNIQNVTLADWLSYDSNDDQIFFQQITDSYGIEDIGQQYFQNGANGLIPVCDFRKEHRSDAIALAVVLVVGNLPSPYSGSVDWQHLYVTSGSLAQEILLLYTDGGEPPSQVRIPRSVMCSARLNVAFFWCTPGSGDILVKFTAQYCKCPADSESRPPDAEMTLTIDLSTLCRVIWW